MKLSGIRVLDLSRFLPGPHLTMMMADHGAEVIKVEDTRTGDATRHIGPAEGGQTVYYRNANRGKRSLAVNLKDDEGRALFLKLAATADVIVETFRPGVVDRLGIGYGAVKPVAPRLVYCSISAFGQSGPYRDRPAHDLSVNALAGILSMSVGADGRPNMPCLPPSDLAGSLMAFSGILMALLRRAETGEGDYVDLGMYDAALSWTPHIVGRVFGEGRAPDPATERTQGGAAFYGTYQTGDGRWISLGGGEMKFVENFLTAMGREDLISLGREPAGPAQAPLKAYLTKIFLTKTQAEWTAWFEGRDICYAPVLDMKEAFDVPQVAARDMLLTDEAGNRHLGVPIKFAEEPGEPRLEAPVLGADSRGILKELGYAGDEIERLGAEGAVKLG